MKTLSRNSTASTLPNGPATTAPLPGTASNGARPADISSEPGMFDVGFAFAVFTLFWLLSTAVLVLSLAGCWLRQRGLALRRWFWLRRVCAWCDVRLGGNPWAKATSHGICRGCLAKFKHQTPNTKHQDFSYSAAVSPRTTTGTFHL